jgi:hypothetical protein
MVVQHRGRFFFRKWGCFAKGNTLFVIQESIDKGDRIDEESVGCYKTHNETGPQLGQGGVVVGHYTGGKGKRAG